MSGGLFGIRHKDRLYLIMSFTAGVLIAVCFFDIMPEIVSISAEKNLAVINAFIALVFGFLFFHILEKTVLLHHTHIHQEDGYCEHQHIDHKHPTIGILGASGLSFHSFLDGVGIGLGFQVSPHIGFLIAIAVVAHDFSDGLNTVTLMLSNKNNVRSAFKFLLADAITPILGVASTFLFTIPSDWLQLYLGFFAGFLLYIGASDLLPEAYSQNNSYKMIALTLTGVIFIFIVTRFV